MNERIAHREVAADDRIPKSIREHMAVRVLDDGRVLAYLHPIDGLSVHDGFAEMGRDLLGLRPSDDDVVRELVHTMGWPMVAACHRDLEARGLAGRRVGRGIWSDLTPPEVAELGEKYAPPFNPILRAQRSSTKITDNLLFEIYKSRMPPDRWPPTLESWSSRVMGVVDRNFYDGLPEEVCGVRLRSMDGFVAFRISGSLSVYVESAMAPMFAGMLLAFRADSEMGPSVLAPVVARIIDPMRIERHVASSSSSDVTVGQSLTARIMGRLGWRHMYPVAHAATTLDPSVKERARDVYDENRDLLSPMNDMDAKKISVCAAWAELSQRIPAREFLKSCAERMGA